MSDLAAFLLARITEDEQAASAAGAVPWEIIHWPNGSQVLVAAKSIRDEAWRLGHLGHVASVEHRHDVDHIARWDPARVLTECDAKRRIMEQHDGVHDCPSVDWEANDLGGAGWIGCDVLRLLALPYAGHPDYDDTWRP